MGTRARGSVDLADLDLLAVGFRRRAQDERAYSRPEIEDDGAGP
jgi:hypothetical protein